MGDVEEGGLGGDELVDVPPVLDDGVPEGDVEVAGHLCSCACTCGTSENGDRQAHTTIPLHAPTHLVDEHKALEVAALPRLRAAAHAAEALLLALGVEVGGVLQEGPPDGVARYSSVGVCVGW